MALTARVRKQYLQVQVSTGHASSHASYFIASHPGYRGQKGERGEPGIGLPGSPGLPGSSGNGLISHAVLSG